MADAVVIVDDDDAYRAKLVRSFERRGFVALGAADAKGAAYIAKQVAVDFAVVDLRLPGRSGLDVVIDLRAARPAINIVVVTGYGSIATALEAVRRGATHYLTKPVDVDDILVAFAGGRIPGRDDVAVDDVPSLARVEWEHIQRILADCSGNISEAARRLRIQRRSLQRKLAKFPVTK
jgi:two-component system, response regulator RegA